MGEPDHIFLRPPPLWATPQRCAAQRTAAQRSLSQRLGCWRDSSRCSPQRPPSPVCSPRTRPWPLPAPIRPTHPPTPPTSNHHPAPCPAPCRPAAFPFFYIEPLKMKSIIDRFNPKGVPIDQFDTIGE